MAATTLFYTVGLPASGKTTYAKAMVAEGGGQVCETSKDDLRMHPDAPQGRGKREKWVLARQNSIIADALSQGQSIVVHDTNLNPYHQSRFAKLADEHGARLEKIDFTHVDVLECIRRDAARDKPVGETVIWQMWQKYLYEPPQAGSSGLSPAVMVDIDGTLARMVGRGPFEWSKVGEDEPVTHVADLVRTLHRSGVTIVFMSGRDSSCRAATQAWLDKHIRVPGELHMRAHGDSRSDTIVKAELYEAHVAGNYNVQFALDDRNSVVYMWRTRGIPVLQVDYGFF